MATREGGTRYWTDDIGNRWHDDDLIAGILTGAAGVALAFLAAITSIEPEWDRMLLLSTARI